MKFYIISILAILIFSCSKNKREIPVNQKQKTSKYYFDLYKLNQSKEKQGNELNLIKSFELLKSQKNDLTNRKLLYDIVIEFYKNNDIKNLNESSKQLLNFSTLSHDTTNLALAFKSRGNYYFKIQKLDSSYYFYLKTEKLYFKPIDRFNLANILLNKGIVQYLANDYLGAEFSLTRSLSVFKDSENTDKVYGVLNQLGLVHNELEEYDKAVFYHTKALETVKKFNLQNNQYEEAVCYNNLGYLFIKQKKYKEAIINFELGLKNKFIINEDPDLYALLIDNLAYSRLQLSNYNNLPNLFYDALKVREKLNDPSLIVLSNIHLSEYYQKKNDYLSAINFSKKAIKKAKESKLTVNLILALKQGSLVDKKKATQYSKDYIRLSDSLQVVERKSRDRFAKIQFETDEISQENVDLEGRNRTLLYFLMFGGIIILFVFIIRYQRNRAKELLYLQSQQRANEEIFNLMAAQETAAEETRNKEKKKIAKDIHDGVLGRMFGARMNLDSLNNNTDTESAEKRLAYLNELKIIEQDLREISHDLNREKQVLINNFVAIVNDLLEEQRNAFPSKVAFKISEDINWNNINNNIKINMYRILQEGLQNINKYANAKKIEVSISSDAKNIILSIIDNGDGFDANKKKKGIGLQNMISRASDCRGIIDINSIKGEGTTIILTMPITKQS